MRSSKGRGWDNLGGTAPTKSHLPPDVRMPYRSGGISQFNGNRYAAPDKELCHIDTKPSERGRSSDADTWDQSRHGGLNHEWNAQPNASTPRYMPNTGVLTAHIWVDDPKAQGGTRAIDIQSITVPHVCANHLPDRNEDLYTGPTPFIMPATVRRVHA